MLSLLKRYKDEFYQYFPNGMNGTTKRNFAAALVSKIPCLETSYINMKQKFDRDFVISKLHNQLEPRSENKVLKKVGTSTATKERNMKRSKKYIQ
ncbi:hypothetical protein BLOT_004563 [Blomia tropicalis]|nr:hypothetical protein BLOT_004563 [Blomia tropicalis]